MSFQPIVPFSGYAGWRFLERTMERQQQTFAQGPGLRAEADHFRGMIGKALDANDLVSDYRLLKVALGAFGLDDQIASKYLIKKVLQQDTADPDALANQLPDKRWLDFANAFSSGGQVSARVRDPRFVEEIVNRFQTRQFERAVGERDDALRLAMNLERELAGIAVGDSSENAKWYTIMGTPAVRAVFDTALGLPDAFATLDLDRQLGVYKTRVAAMFGADSVTQFTDSATREKLIQNFMIRREINDFGIASSGQIALQLLAVGGAR
ncbi:uncharacterized protein DUF1217 [Rhodovulum bhavnagarense]|uniref:Uncharacterized protein DUF1217 n=1 Tax=Rhodovulum bhavnagarense TaxID=992286 RepID=A0A4V2SW93_9RHOB|nr:DUF1217 domain-containing protein [Rhodovulum bhavnagarense]TCP61196.1 uncharacterized protein DUF1217 [Rhodovulum bhavnagarense]